MNKTNTLTNLGWQHFFQQQLSLDEWEAAHPARIIEHHRSELLVAGEPGCAVKEAKDKALGKFYKSTQNEASRLKGRD